MIVDDFSGIAYKKVRGDESRSPGELPFAALHLPNHWPVLQLRISARPDVALPDCAEVQSVPLVPKRDGADFLKRCFPGKGHLRFKTGLTTTRRLEAAINAASSHYSWDYTTLSGRGALRTVPASLAGTAFPLNCSVYRICVTSPPQFVWVLKDLYSLEGRCLTPLFFYHIACLNRLLGPAVYIVHTASDEGCSLRC